jgi:exodeoxyribonuclease V alpha subunit
LEGVHGHRAIRPVRLPEVSSAWALTIHRTQGSEYDHILLVVPPAEDSKILSRELLYTGLSRAKVSATLWCEEEGFRATVDTTVRRASGLPAMFAADRG